MRTWFLFVAIFGIGAASAPAQVLVPPDQPIEALSPEQQILRSMQALIGRLQVAPERIQELPARAQAVQNRLIRLQRHLQRTYGPLDADKARLAGELWRVRHSINWIVLLQPEWVAELTGLEPQEIQAIQRELARLNAAAQRLRR
jgi:hypothetical protein